MLKGGLYIMDAASIKQEYQDAFDVAPQSVFFSPGRINLIGEHTDYNGGHVFPCAITLGTYGAASPRTDTTVRLYSGNLPKDGVLTFDVNDLSFNKGFGWGNYPKGMLYELAKKGAKFDHGFDLYVHGNLPDGSGLSSSASLELLVGVIAKKLYNLEVEQMDLVYAGQQVENDYIGLNSGIMDQFAIGMGKKDQAMFLDVNTMKYEYYPVDLGDNVVLIMNSNKSHDLASSKYNERRSQCEEALRRIQQGVNVKTLGDLTKEQFDQATYLINDATLIRRARHAVFENQRTIDAKQALDDHDLKTFGHLVSASHISLQYDYEVSVPELDTLVDTAWAQDGVLGARIIGGGFGGCAIAIVSRDQVDHVKEVVGDTYLKRFGYAADFYVAEIADGTHEVTA
ncbi:galactokinase [Furfurilactobacillus rossiae DSM 15814]|uniref:Galactokinase n=2 Tax=Furfurilactobacillus rossiae TaxID=231049 RepID=A0A0R1RTM0_9LACO|nr:galactokinase [Furfurilactobacillus rossiae DSM 15814]